MQRAGCAGGAVRIEPDHDRVVAALADRRALDRDHGRLGHRVPTVGSGRRSVLVCVFVLVWQLMVWMSWRSPGTLNDRFGNSLVGDPGSGRPPRSSQACAFRQLRVATPDLLQARQSVVQRRRH
jgi:hypothetical protein